MFQYGLLDEFTKAAPEAICFSSSVAELNSETESTEFVKSERNDEFSFKEERMPASMVPSGVFLSLL